MRALALVLAVLPLLPAASALEWEAGDPTDPGDDRVRLEYDTTTRVEAGAQAPVGAKVAPHDLAFEHDAAPVVREAVGAVDSLSPGTLRQRASVGEREVQGAPGERGIFLTVRAREVDRRDLGAGLCWNLNACPLRWPDNPLYATDDRSVRAFPNDLWLRAWNTDDFGAGALSYPCARLEGRPCPYDRQEAAGTLHKKTPRIETHVRWGGLDVRFSSPAGPEPASAETPPGRSLRDALSTPAVLPVEGPIGPMAATALPSKPSPALGAPPRAPIETKAPGPGRLPAMTGSSAPLLALGCAAALLVAWMFSRIAHGDVLESPVRRRILALVRARPGIAAEQAARLLQVDRTTAEYHLWRLARAGFVRSAGARRHWYDAELFDRDRARQAHVAASPLARALLAHLRLQPGASISESARALNASRGAVCTLASRLEDVGLVFRVVQGRRHRLFPSPKASGAEVPPAVAG
ncbi:MAG TPA: helix-turn-helix domain-containing protein [Candidatus Thermoplasmatota archaeon]|nr:helix-turn-helix domain-containing protein [Candidatus Thermoplasmatota archaeon]